MVIQNTAVCQVHACQIEFQAILHFNIYTFWLFLAFTGGVPWVHFWLPPKKVGVCEIIFSLGLPEVAALSKYGC